MKQVLAQLVTASTIAMIAVGCGDKNKSNETQSAEGTLKNSSVSSSSTGLHTKVLDKVHCENPIPLEDNTLQRIRTLSELDKGKWVLKMIDIYVVDTNNESYHVTSSADSDFKPLVACNGLSDLSAENFERSRTYFDDNGDAHIDTHISSSTTKYSASAKWPEWFDTSIIINSGTIREVEVAFKNALLTKSRTTVVPVESNSMGLDGTLGADNVQIGTDAYVHGRAYLGATGFELRIKGDGPVKQDGKRQQMFGRALYVLSK